MFLNTNDITVSRVVLPELQDVGLLNCDAANSIGVRGLKIGNDRNQPNRPWGGPICEIVVTDFKLPIADKERMEGYTAHRWGFADKLPALHPYKDDPPEL